MILPLAKERLKSQKEQYEEKSRLFWESAPREKLDPTLSNKGRLRIERTLALIEKELPIQGQSLIDLGSGVGVLATALADLGAQVTALDIAERALELCTHSEVQKTRGCIPYLRLDEGRHFDGVLFTDVIAEIDPSLHRLTLSELSRILKPEGWLVCSTELDIYSKETQKIFLELLQTEFQVSLLIKSYHRLHFYLLRMAKAPFRFIRAARESEYRRIQLERRGKLMRFWFYLNSLKPLSHFWNTLLFIFRPLLSWLQNSERALLIFEWISKGIWREGGVTHLIVLARKRKI